MTVYLLRHGRTAYNEQRRYQGRSDPPLSPAGAAELRAADFTPEAVYTSPLLRARQTARILFPAARQEVVAALAEMDFGDFEGRTADEMAQDAAYRAWVDGGCTGPCPNGESLAQFCDRTCRAFAALVERAAAEGQEELVIVAHGGTQRAVMERLCEPPVAYFDLRPPFGGGWALQYDAGLWAREKRLRLLGEVCFAKGVAAC